MAKPGDKGGGFFPHRPASFALGPLPPYRGKTLDLAYPPPHTGHSGSAPILTVRVWAASAS